MQEKRENAGMRKRLPRAAKATSLWNLFADRRATTKTERRPAGGVRQSSPAAVLFDVAWYLDRNPDVAAAEFEPLDHYLEYGGKEGRDPSPLFHSRWYLAKNPDVAEAGANPLDHFYLHGALEGRDPSPLFHTAWYVKQNPDVTSAGLNPLAHYSSIGALQGRNPSPLFHSSWYLVQNPDVAAAGINPLAHYYSNGAAEGRDPSPLFDTSWYLEKNPDVAAIGINPLEHYHSSGAAEGRDPSPLFDTSWYLEKNPDVAAKGVNPLAHYYSSGAAEGRDPSPLFDTSWYLEQNPDVAAAGFNPLAHYYLSGAVEGRNPSPLFDTSWYLKQNPDVAAADINPLVHYLLSGASEGRDPVPLFDSSWYLDQNPDVAASEMNPLVHYQLIGAAEGRDPSSRFDSAWYRQEHPDLAWLGISPLQHYREFGAPNGLPTELSNGPLLAVRGRSPFLRLLGRYEEHGDLSAATLLRLDYNKLEAFSEYFLPNRPINVFIDHRLNTRPSVQILLPSIRREHASGGPNTAYILGSLLAQAGFRVNFVSTDVGPDADLGGIKSVLQQLMGADTKPIDFGFIDASDRNRPLGIGYNDIFLATAWWTAHAARSAAQLTRTPRIYYLVQDYETLFYGASENFADAEASYNIDHVPIINTQMLRDHLVAGRIGRYADPYFAARALVFEPAVSDAHFYPERKSPGPRKLLFYARPTLARRNLFGLGIAALRAAVEGGVFGHGGWEFIGMGEAFDPLPLGRGFVLRPAPWLDFDGYAEQMRGADLLLSLMLSPHPSYPPLEMAACGGTTVTTEFGSKTAQRLRKISPHIIGVQPTIEDLVLALARAVAIPPTPPAASDYAPAPLNLPGDWLTSLSAVIPGLIEQFAADGCRPVQQCPKLPHPVTFVKSSVEIPGSPPDYVMQMFERERRYRRGSSIQLLSLVTTVYDTKATYVADLAHTVLGQDTDFEWLILDNGSTNRATRKVLAEIAKDRRVRLERVVDNLGIVGGMRWCLEHATARYVLPLDSDDLLFPDCLRVVTSFLEQAGFPALIYTDEDKTNGSEHRDAYYKPDWDPVLFIHSCFIAHLTAIDRIKAIELGCYSDLRAEGCHDWDTFCRFFDAGYKPHHLPELIYSWRMHAGSTAGNYKSKPFIYDSHRFVLERFLAVRGMLDKYELTLAPLFNGTPDYRFASRTELSAGGGSRWQKIKGEQASAELSETDEIAGHSASIGFMPTLILQEVVSSAALSDLLAPLPEDAEIVRLIDEACTDRGALGFEEARALMDLFPDTVLVGGRLHRDSHIVEAGYVFGYGGVIGCPDVGRALNDPGYFAQMWKPHSVAAVSARFCVVNKQFLAASLARLPERLPLSMLGPWLGGLARLDGRRTVYSPYIVAAAPNSGPLLISDADAQAYRNAFLDILDDTVGYSPRLDRSGRLAFQPGTQEAPAVLPTYRDHHEEWASREARGSINGPTITILTTVYSRTDADLFCETARAVVGQSQRPHEWLVLAHGPVTEELDLVLKELESEGSIRLLRTEINLGIHGGMRYCLERAKGDFVVPLDADDLLERDAVRILSGAAASNTDISIFFSDEDLLVHGKPQGPCYRPDLDPFSLFAHSTIWHAILFRRDIGMRLGVFTNEDAEYAQDWDLVLRFHLNGYKIGHVAAIIYHWRQHGQSLSNSGAAFAGSIRSVRAVLAMISTSLGLDRLLEISPYPVDLGSPSLYLKRTAVEAPDVDLVVYSDARKPARKMVGIDFPFNRQINALGLRGPAGLAATMAALKESTAEFVMLIGPALIDIEVTGIWQAIKHFEMHQTCLAVGGALAHRSGLIAFGSLVETESGKLLDPVAGRSLRDPGPLSLALLPQSVNALSPDCMLVRRDMCLGALEAAPTGYGLRNLGVWLGSYAGCSGLLLCYEPLLRCYIATELDLLGDDVEALNRAKLALQTGATAGRVPLRGLAGFSRNALLHS